jgi:hypothetical protein
MISDTLVSQTVIARRLEADVATCIAGSIFRL